jgi:pantothenate kinase
MSDLSQDAQEIRRIAANVTEIYMNVQAASTLNEVHEKISAVLKDSPISNEFRSRLTFGTKMIQDYVSWLQELNRDMNELASRIENAGMGGGPFG